MADFQLVGPRHAILRMGSIYEDIPRCLQIAFFHYLGLSSATKMESNPACPWYCHCQMIHLPIPPVDTRNLSDEQFI